MIRERAEQMLGGEAKVDSALARGAVQKYVDKNGMERYLIDEDSVSKGERNERVWNLAVDKPLSGQALKDVESLS